MNSNYYHLLNLQEGASIQEIKIAYRRLALKYHPDKSSSARDGEKFKIITEAYQVLKAGKKNHTITDHQRFYDKFFAERGVDSTSQFSLDPRKIFKVNWYRYTQFTEKLSHDFKYAEGTLKYRAMVLNSATSVFIHSTITRYSQIPSRINSQIHDSLLKKWYVIRTGLKNKANLIQKAFQSTTKRVLYPCHIMYDYRHLPMVKIEEMRRMANFRERKEVIDVAFVQKVPVRIVPFIEQPIKHDIKNRRLTEYHIGVSGKFGKFSDIFERDEAYFATAPQSSEWRNSRSYGARRLCEMEHPKTHYGRIATGDVLVDPTIRWRNRHPDCLP